MTQRANDATRARPRRWAGLNVRDLNSRKPLASRNDRAERRVSGRFRFGAGGVRVEIAVDVTKNTMTATAMLGDTRPAELLRVQERASMAQIIPDDPIPTIRAASYYPGTTAFRTMFDLLARDI